MVGQNINAAIRLVTAALVVRTLGTTIFGEYSLIGVWVAISEWILDFGTTEVFVREANQAPHKRAHFVRIFMALKFIQAPLALLFLLGGLLAMQYSDRIIVAGMTSGISLLFIAGVSLCRATFKSTLTMHREVVSESISAVSMLAMLPLVVHFDWGLMGLMGIYVVSRAVFLAGCVISTRDMITFSVRGAQSADILWGIRSSMAIGVIGFVVVAYTSADMLALSRLASLSDVATYSAALRFTQPLVLALNAIAVSVYPVLALLKSPERFRETCQRAVDITLFLGSLALVTLWSGAEFFMSLLGPALVTGGDALRILAAMCVIKAVSLVVGPVLFLVRAQNYALGYVVVALILKVAVMIAVIPRYGYIGAAAGTLGVELFFLAPVSLWFVRAFTGFQIQFLGILRVVAIVAAVLAVVRILFPGGTVAGAAAAAVLYMTLTLTFRVVRVSELRAMLTRTPPESHQL
jgi:O-antigen/teichoic acid export membrane protein